MNCIREIFSFSLHEVAGEAMVSSSTRGRPKKGMASLLTLLLYEKCGALRMVFLFMRFDLSSNCICKDPVPEGG